MQMCHTVFVKVFLVCVHPFAGHWNIESLSRVLKAQPSVIRKHVGFWVSHGLLKEQSTDEYTLVQEQKLPHNGTTARKYLLE